MTLTKQMRGDNGEKSIAHAENSFRAAGADGDFIYKNQAPIERRFVAVWRGVHRQQHPNHWLRTTIMIIIVSVTVEQFFPSRSTGGGVGRANFIIICITVDCEPEICALRVFCRSANEFRLTKYVDADLKRRDTLASIYTEQGKNKRRWFHSFLLVECENG